MLAATSSFLDRAIAAERYGGVLSGLSGPRAIGCDYRWRTHARHHLRSGGMTTPEVSNRGLIGSALLAGFISGFIWMAITVLTGGFGKGAIVGGGFGFLVGTALVTAIIARLVRGRAHR